MKILAIDTATEACSVALYNSDLGHEKDDSIFEVCPQQHSQQILPMIDNLLKRNQLKMSDVDALAYGCGPGSFTGLRIAASTVQGLSLGANIPVLEVSTLATMAQQNYNQYGSEETLALIDARMQEVYAGHYKVIDGIAHLQQKELVMPPIDAENFLNSLRSVDTTSTSLFAGTGYIAYANLLLNNSSTTSVDINEGATKELANKALANSGLLHVDVKVLYPNAKYMLPLALSSLHQSKAITAAEISPVYIRDKVTWKKLPHKM